MKISFIVLLASFFVSCSIVKIDNNGSTAAPPNRSLGIDHHPVSILDHEVDLQSLTESGNSSQNGRFFIFLVNDSIFLDAAVSRRANDSIFLTGSITNKLNGEMTDFMLSYRSADLNYSLYARQHDFRVDLQTNNPEFRDSADVKTFYIRHSRNFIVQRNTAELVTGEISTANQRYKFMVVNDPAKFSEYLKSVCLLTTITRQELEAACRDKFQNKCSKGYKRVIHYSFSLYKKIFCECK